MTRRRIWVFAAVQVVLVLLLAEVALRLVAPRHPTLRRLLFEPASVERIAACDTLEELMETSIVGFRPGTPEFGFVLNSRSLRTSEYRENKAPGVVRILAFGDSFTWASGGLPHRQHWPTILERDLAAGGFPKAEVLRFGVPATGPAFQLRLWELEGSRLHADIVVVGFFVGNDFTDHQRVADDEIRAVGWRRRLIRSSAVIRAALNLRRMWTGVESSNDPAKLPGGVPSPSPGNEIPGGDSSRRYAKAKLSVAQHLAIEERRMMLSHASKRGTFEDLLATAAATLIRFRDEVEAAGARFVVMVIPDEYQVSPSLAAAVAKHGGRDLSEYDLGLPQRRLDEVLSAAGVEVVDLLPAFAERGAEEKLYGVRDTHWNHRGNILAASVLASRLRSDGGRDAVVRSTE